MEIEKLSVVFSTQQANICSKLWIKNIDRFCEFCAKYTQS